MALSWRTAGRTATRRVSLAALVASLSLMLALFTYAGPSRLIASMLLAYVAGGSTYLLTAGAVVMRSTSLDLARHAAATDAGRGTLLGLVVGASAAVVSGALALLRGQNGSASAGELLLGLTLAATVLAWLVTNVAFALHYAHLHYEPVDRHEPSLTASGAGGEPDGFVFPGSTQPDGLDFAYLAFTVGMTFQVSDVQVTDRRCRRAVLGHGLLAFSYSTLIVALVVNAALSQLQRGAP